MNNAAGERSEPAASDRSAVGFNSSLASADAASTNTVSPTSHHQPGAATELEYKAFSPVTTATARELAVDEGDIASRVETGQGEACIPLLSITQLRREEAVTKDAREVQRATIAPEHIYEGSAVLGGTTHEPGGWRPRRALEAHGTIRNGDTNCARVGRSQDCAPNSCREACVSVRLS